MGKFSVSCEGETGEKQLVAYIVGKADAGQLRAEMERLLPSYMLPGAYVELESLPLNANGKLDRRALPTFHPGQSQESTDVYLTALQSNLRDLWRNLLGQTETEEITLDDDFFDLGGYSLLATRMFSRVRELYQVEIPPSIFFNSPTIRSLSELIDKIQERNESPAIRPVPRTRPLPLSFAQQRLWFLDQLVPGTPFYNMAESYRIRGLLSVSKLIRSFNEVIKRHESLRSKFQSRNGEPVQIISPAKRLTPCLIDLQLVRKESVEIYAQSIARELAQLPFSLSSGPLLRLAIIRIAPNDHILLQIVHHIIYDAVSRSILIKEVSAIYRALTDGRDFELADLPIQYADYAHWQRSCLTEPVLTEHLEYWKAAIGPNWRDYELFPHRHEASDHSFLGALYPFTFDKDLSRSLRQLAVSEGTTLFMLLVAGFKALLYRYTGKREIAIGTSVDNRNRPELEHLIGFFVNMLVLRTPVDGDSTFRELLQKVKDVTLSAYDHQDLPFEKLVQELQPERAVYRQSLFQVVFAMLQVPKLDDSFPGLAVSTFKFKQENSMFDFIIGVMETPAGLAGNVQYSTDLFEEHEIRELFHSYRSLLKAIVQYLDLRILDLPLSDEIAPAIETQSPHSRPQAVEQFRFES